MTDSIEEIEERKLVAVRLYDIPEEDWLAFKEVMKAFGYNKATAFRACIDAYYVMRQLGEMHVRIDALEELVKSFAHEEQKEVAKGTKTFGGGMIGGKENG